MTIEASEAREKPVRSTARRPLVALLANLLLFPVGYLYVGAAQPGLVAWVAAWILWRTALVPFLVLPGRQGVLMMMAAVLVLSVFYVFVFPIDAYRRARREAADYRPRPYNRWYVYVGVVLLGMAVDGILTGALRTQFQAFRMPSESMMPTLAVGDYFFIDKTSGRLRGLSRGVVVVFPFPQDRTKDFVKRIVGLPNEVIEIRDKQVLVNGTPLHEPYAFHGDRAIRPGGSDTRDNFGPRRLGPRDYFVMGDNRDNSNDSRFWGNVIRSEIKGVARVIYWSWDRDGFAVRWNRIGMEIH